MNGTEEREKEIKLLNAAAWFDSSRVTQNLMQLIGYRQKVAQEILDFKGTEEELKALRSMMEYAGEQIKMLIGLD